MPMDVDTPIPLWMRSIRIRLVGIFFKGTDKNEGVGKVFSKSSDKNPTSKNLLVHTPGSDREWNVPPLGTIRNLYIFLASFCLLCVTATVDTKSVDEKIYK